MPPALPRLPVIVPSADDGSVRFLELSFGSGTSPSARLQPASTEAHYAAMPRRNRVMAPGKPRTFSTRPVSSYSSETTRVLS